MPKELKVKVGFSPSNPTTTQKITFIAQAQGKCAPFLIALFPGVTVFAYPFGIELINGLLNVFGKRVPFILIHDHEETGRVADGIALGGRCDDFGLFPSFKYFHGGDGGFGHTGRH